MCTILIGEEDSSGKAITIQDKKIKNQDWRRNAINVLETNAIYDFRAEELKSMKQLAMVP